MASTASLIAYYSDLLILQYRGKTKAPATIAALVKGVIMDQLPVQVQDAFGIDTAVGVQLDVLGKYAGVSRSTYDFSGAVTLDDDDFRTLIKVAIIKNNAGSSLYDIDTLLNGFFPGTLLAFDYANMHMDYLFSAEIGSMQLAEVFVKNGLLPKPMGVLLGALIYAPVIDEFFGFRTYEVPAALVNGFNTYSDYNEDWPWLSYDNAIIP